MTGKLFAILTAALFLSAISGCTKKEDSPNDTLITELQAKVQALQAEVEKLKVDNASAAAPPEPTAETAFPVPGKWKITGYGDEKGVYVYTAYMTINEVTNTEFDASIDWHDRAGSVAKENVKGAYNPRNRQITITRGYGAYVDRDVFKGLFDNINGDTFTAYLSEDGRAFTQGKWMNGGEWEAQLPENGVDFPEEYNPEESFRPQWAWDDY